MTGMLSIGGRQHVIVAVLNHLLATLDPEVDSNPNSTSIFLRLPLLRAT